MFGTCTASRSAPISLFELIVNTYVTYMLLLRNICYYRLVLGPAPRAAQRTGGWRRAADAADRVGLKHNLRMGGIVFDSSIIVCGGVSLRGPWCRAGAGDHHQVVGGTVLPTLRATANLHTNVLDFRWFDSSIILILRGGILIPTGNFPEDLRQAILVGTILVGTSGVPSGILGFDGAHWEFMKLACGTAVDNVSALSLHPALALALAQTPALALALALSLRLSSLHRATCW